MTPAWERPGTASSISSTAGCRSRRRRNSRPRSADVLLQIMDIQVRKLVARLDERGISITNAAKDYIAREGLRPGVRREAAQTPDPERDQDVLALKLLQGEFGEGRRWKWTERARRAGFSAVSAPSAVEA